jgi:hypothetical protein
MNKQTQRARLIEQGCLTCLTLDLLEQHPGGLTKDQIIHVVDYSMKLLGASKPNLPKHELLIIYDTMLDFVRERYVPDATMGELLAVLKDLQWLSQRRASECHARS